MSTDRPTTFKFLKIELAAIDRLATRLNVTRERAIMSAVNSLLAGGSARQAPTRPSGPYANLIDAAERGERRSGAAGPDLG